MRSDVTFRSSGLALAGHLHTPDDDGPVTDAGRPAVVVGHPGSGVKEQAAGLYARRLAARGFTALAFDAAYQGESEGEPRGLEDPAQRVEDLRSAVSFLAALDGVDAGRIGLLGICASGGYALSAAATDRRVRAVATVSAVDISRMFRLGADGAQDPALLDAMLDAAAEARTAEARGEGTRRFPLFPETEQEARRSGRYGYEGWEYYRTPRAAHPRSATELTWSSVERIAAFDAFAPVGLIAPRPLAMVVGREAATAWMSLEAFRRAAGPKELHWIEGASHTDLYDRDAHVTPAVTHLTAFFRTHLTP